MTSTTPRPRGVVITGASSGIGAALARACAARGDRLVLLGRDRERLDAVRASLPVDSTGLIADVGDLAAMRAAADDIRHHSGTPDVVIASAGVSIGTLAGDGDDLLALERVLRTNVLGIAASFQPFVAAMRERGSGTLAGIASVAGLRGLPGAGAYSASKAAAIALLESMRVELHGSGVRVVTLAPGYIDTPMTRVNPYPMPFLMDVDKAASKRLSLIDRQRSFAIVPWQMGVAGRLMRLLPDSVHDRLFAHAGRKPRGLPL